MTNERDTESIVRDHFRSDALIDQRLEEQISNNPIIRRLLASASKSGSGTGKPEFVVTFPDSAPNLAIVVECKGDRAKHESPDHSQPRDYAVDGVLVYARALAQKFDVIAIAVSGTDVDHLRVSTFRQLRGTEAAQPLLSPSGTVDRLVSPITYIQLLDFDPAVRARTEAELLTFSRQLHNYMRDYAKLSEAEKPLVVSGILLALRDNAFKRNWQDYKPRFLSKELYSAIERVAQDSDIPEEKRETMLAPYSFVKTHPELTRANANGEAPLARLVGDIDEHVRPFLDTYHDVDIIGQFYGEFLRYTGGDKKGLGIVLTPRHLTELFVQLAGVGPQDVVLDTCAGTGGFLIAAMAELDRQVGVDDVARERIRQHQLVGVEQLPHMFALAASNMILRGDGKANLYRGSCFDKSIVTKLRNGVPERHARPTVGLINPPFSQKGDGQHELDFILNLLEAVTPGGTVVAVVPMSCAIEPHPTKSKILANHTLVAQMSLPNDLFAPVGTITCAMVFRAHRPHAANSTWFGYWKDDGFVKTKNRGRIDLNGEWDAIRAEWLEDFHLKRTTPGRSVNKVVSAQDEWTVEAYLETDYAALGASELDDTIRKYAIFKLMFGDDAGEEILL